MLWRRLRLCATPRISGLTSIVERWRDDLVGPEWGFDNLRRATNGLIPTRMTVNPTLTGTALALHVADKIAQSWSRSPPIRPMLAPSFNVGASDQSGTVLVAVDAAFY